MKNLVSVIIPVYNVENYIEECITSIAVQTYRDIEIIIVDDCSCDNSISIAKQVLSNYNIPWRIISHEKNRGQAAARNNGLLSAQGEFILYVDSDDYLPPDAIEHLFTLNLRYKTDITVGNIEHVSEVGETKQSAWGQIFNEHGTTNALDALFREELYASPCNKIIKRSFLINNQLFFKEGVVYEDESWVFSLALNAKSIYFSPKKTYFYRQRLGSTMNKEYITSKEVNSSHYLISFINKMIYDRDIKLDKKFSRWYIERFLAYLSRIKECVNLTQSDKNKAIKNGFKSFYFPKFFSISNNKIYRLTIIFSYIIPTYYAYRASNLIYDFINSLTSK